MRAWPAAPGSSYPLCFFAPLPTLTFSPPPLASFHSSETRHVCAFGLASRQFSPASRRSFSSSLSSSSQWLPDHALSPCFLLFRHDRERLSVPTVLGNRVVKSWSERPTTLQIRRLLNSTSRTILDIAKDLTELDIERSSALPQQSLERSQTCNCTRESCNGSSGEIRRRVVTITSTCYDGQEDTTDRSVNKASSHASNIKTAVISHRSRHTSSYGPKLCLVRRIYGMSGF